MIIPASNSATRKYQALGGTRFSDRYALYTDLGADACAFIVVKAGRRMLGFTRLFNPMAKSDQANVFTEFSTYVINDFDGEKTEYRPGRQELAMKEYVEDYFWRIVRLGRLKRRGSKGRWTTSAHLRKSKLNSLIPDLLSIWTHKKQTS